VGLRWLGATVLVALALGGTFVGQALTAGPGGWDHVGDGGTAGSDSLNGNVNVLNSDAPGLLLVGGEFTDAGGKPAADKLASWNGSTWSSVGNASDQLNGGVFAIAYANGKTYAGGSFTDAGGDQNADFLAVWDGQTWAPFCGGAQHPFNGNVKALQIVGSTLYVGGEFQDGAGLASADYLVACDLSNNGAPSSTVPDEAHAFMGSVYALTADSNGGLYAGGVFIDLALNSAADKVAYLPRGRTWQPVGATSRPCGCAVDDNVRSLTATGTDVYVGTDAKNVAEIPQADNVARWDGTAWHAVGAGASGADGWFPAGTSIDALTSFDSKLFAGGTFQNAGGDPTADYVAVYDGAAWHPVGSNGAGDGALPAKASALAVFDRLAPAGDPRRVFAGGSFTSAGGDNQANRIASYSLTAITPVATPTVTPGAGAVPTPVPTPTPNPAAAPTPTPRPDVLPPKIGALRLASTTFRAAPSGAPFRAARAAVGTDVSFTLSEPAKVRFTIDRSTTGRKVKGRCVKLSPKNRSRPRCARWIPVEGSFTVKGKKGANKIELRGRIGGKTLKPGRYRLNARATDPAGNLSVPKRTAFTIDRPLRRRPRRPT
jgi:hypothetical protein